MENKTVKPTVTEKEIAINVLNCFRRLRLSALYVKRIKHKDISVLSELNRVDSKVLGMWFRALPADVLGDLMEMILDPASVNYSRKYASVSKFNGRVKYNIEDKETGLFSRPKVTPLEEEINKLEMRLKNLKRLQAMNVAPAPKSAMEEIVSGLQVANMPVEIKKIETVELGVSAMEDLQQAMASLFDSIPPAPKTEKIETVAAPPESVVMTEVLEVAEPFIEGVAEKPAKKKKAPKKAPKKVAPKKKSKKTTKRATKKALSKSRKRKV